MQKIIEIPTSKKCSCCKELKSVYSFCNSKRYKSGKHNVCKTCVRSYIEKNRVRILEVARTRYISKRDLIRKQQAEYRTKNRSKVNKQKLEHYRKNRKLILARASEYEKDKLRNDPHFRFKHSLRSRIRIAIKNKYKSGSAVRDIGCSGEEAFKYIESLFSEGMSWNNYGEWHIDHIRPLASFNLEDRDQFLEAVNYKNLRPLWASDNLSKGDKYENH